MNTPDKSIMTKNLKYRVLTAVPMAVVAIWYMFFAPKLIFITISFILALIGIWEFCRALNQTKVKFSSTVIYLSALVNLAAFCVYQLGRPSWSIILIGANLLMVLIFSIQKWKEGKYLLLWYLFPQFWIIGPICLIITLRFSIAGDSGSHLILFVLLIAIFNDIFAFFGGKAFGKHLLAPTISPKKTIEGSIFGLAGGFVAGYGLMLLNPFYHYQFSSNWIFVISILCITIASQAGDLLESRFKRYCKIKDSSNLIPGHGGLLDRFDAYLFAIPVFVCILYLLGIPAK